MMKRVREALLIVFLTGLAAVIVGLSTAHAATDALDEVNAIRAGRGLPAYRRDAALTQAAMSAADYRARYGMHHHTSNDFSFLPAGAWAAGAGCDGSAIRSGWLTCYSESLYPYAGAACAYDANGIKFCHLFVYDRPNPVAAVAQAAVKVVQAVTHPVQAVQAVRENRAATSQTGERRGLFGRMAARLAARRG